MRDETNPYLVQALKAKCLEYTTRAEQLKGHTDAEKERRQTPHHQKPHHNAPPAPSHQPSGDQGPQYMSNEVGIEMAKEAVAADKAGRFHEARAKYIKTTDILMAALQYEQRPAMVSAIRERCLQYIARAEKLEPKIAAQQEATASAPSAQRRAGGRPSEAKAPAAPSGKAGPSGAGRAPGAAEAPGKAPPGKAPGKASGKAGVASVAGPAAGGGGGGPGDGPAVDAPAGKEAGPPEGSLPPVRTRSEELRKRMRRMLWLRAVEMVGKQRDAEELARLRGERDARRQLEEEVTILRREKANSFGGGSDGGGGPLGIPVVQGINITGADSIQALPVGLPVECEPVQPPPAELV